MGKNITLDKLKTILDPILHLISKCVKSVNGVYPDKDGNVELKIDSGLPSGGAPHQMLVTDADGKAVWEERTHYRKFEEVTCFHETIKIEDGGAWIKLSAIPAVGTTCKVTFDGAQYDCVVQDHVDSLRIGNNSLFPYGDEDKPDTGEPFLLDVYPEDEGAEVFTNPEDNDYHTIRMDGYKEHAEKLDDKYLHVCNEYLRGITSFVDMQEYFFMHVTLLENVTTWADVGQGNWNRIRVATYNENKYYCFNVSWDHVFENNTAVEMRATWNCVDMNNNALCRLYLTFERTGNDENGDLTGVLKSVSLEGFPSET